MVLLVNMVWEDILEERYSKEICQENSLEYRYIHGSRYCVNLQTGEANIVSCNKNQNLVPNFGTPVKNCMILH